MADVGYIILSHNSQYIQNITDYNLIDIIGVSV